MVQSEQYINFKNIENFIFSVWHHEMSADERFYEIEDIILNSFKLSISNSVLNELENLWNKIIGNISEYPEICVK